MFDLLLSIFLVYQYWILFAVVFIASIGFPIPATALMMVGGAFYAQGYFDIGYLMLSGYLGAILGDAVAFLLSYFYGRQVFYTIGLRKILDSTGFTAFEPAFLRHSMLSVFLTRFLFSGLGPATNILAGLSRMTPVRFFIADIAGEFLYILLYLSIGYSFSSEWEIILELIESFSAMIITFGIFSVVLYFFWKKHRIGEDRKFAEEI